MDHNALRDYFELANILLVPILIYLIKNERRLTVIETTLKIDERNDADEKILKAIRTARTRKEDSEGES